jgi:hypothetical protein
MNKAPKQLFRTPEIVEGPVTDELGMIFWRLIPRQARDDGAFYQGSNFKMP